MNSFRLGHFPNKSLVLIRIEQDSLLDFISPCPSRDWNDISLYFIIKYKQLKLGGYQFDEI